MNFGPDMQHVIRMAMLGYMQNAGMLLDEAAAQLHGAFEPDLVKKVADELRAQQRAQLKVADTSTDPYVQLELWYNAPAADGESWVRFAETMTAGGSGGLLPKLKETADSTLAMCAKPLLRGAKRKGLVIGNVQSGKTANYTALIARAVDAGYRFVIVLAGVHNNLRSQTQSRLAHDLITPRWYQLTDSDHDFQGRTSPPDSVMSKDTVMVAVVKKNTAPLRKLLEWFTSAPASLRANCPVLVIDDEADQATPSSAARADEVTAINRQMKALWKSVSNGTYLAYTATPFANVFMDPEDDEDLFPSDFIRILEPGAGYFGAKQIFGSSGSEDDPDSDGLDMVRDIPQDDVDALRPPSQRAKQESYEPEVPDSMERAVMWFLLATAARRARGQKVHSSMLVHITHFAVPHFAIKTALKATIERLRVDVDEEMLDEFEDLWTTEKDRAKSVRVAADVTWSEVAAQLPEVVQDVRVVVDNGSSDDRLDYDRKDAQGEELIETVIAVGGGTLSRGLTLNGLVVSYFIRTTTMYDTLLQMGRWFGYRSGYEDLPRIWAPKDLIDDFRFLAQVEDDLRDEILRLAHSGKSPKQLGVRVRAHPGRLEITARNKMKHAKHVQVSLSGQRRQTFIYDVSDPDILAANWQALESFLAASPPLEPMRRTPERLWTRGIASGAIANFLREYRFHEDQRLFDDDLLTDWIEQRASTSLWNVVVMGNSSSLGGDRKTPLGNQTIAGHVVATVNRTPLRGSVPTKVDIKALMSTRDRVADLPDVDLNGAKTDLGLQEVRDRHANGRGLLLVYPISAHSTPRKTASGSGRVDSASNVSGSAPALSSRVPMDAPANILGIGIVFPRVDTDSDDGDFMSVVTPWEIDAGEYEDSLEDPEQELS